MSEPSQKGDDGHAIPPPELIAAVAGAADVPWFLESGRRAANNVRETLEKNGLDLDGFRSILDFGCGCGRVIRHWNPATRAKLYGVDCNPHAIAWCRRQLPEAHFATTRLQPPLPYADDTFDFIYALSVFTHLPRPLQVAWTTELARVMVRRGYLLLSTHGESYLPQLTGAEQLAFCGGRLVVRNEAAGGTNSCAAFHPPAYVRGTLARGIEVIDFIAEGAAGNPHQDLYLLRTR